MSEPNSTLSLIVRIAGKAIDKDREQRSESGVSSGRIEALLLYLTVIKRLARSALPEIEQPHCHRKKVRTLQNGSHKNS
jgi:hypothetical protein